MRPRPTLGGNFVPVGGGVLCPGAPVGGGTPGTPVGGGTASGGGGTAPGGGGAPASGGGSSHGSGGYPGPPIPGPGGTPTGAGSGPGAPPVPNPGNGPGPVGPPPPPAPLANERAFGFFARSAFGKGLAANRWEIWWRLNQEAYLDGRGREGGVPRAVSRTADLDLGDLVGGDLVPPSAGRGEAARSLLLPLLLDATSHDAATVRAEAALALGRAGGRDHASLLLELVGDEDRSVRQMALLALGLTGSSGASPVLQSCVTDRGCEDAERACAALALGLQGDDRAVPALVAVLHQTRVSREVMAAVLCALGLIRTDDAAIELIRVVEREDVGGELRAVAVVALGRQQLASEVTRLIGLLEDREVHVRRSAALALGRMRYASRGWARRDRLLAQQARWAERRTLGPEARRRFREHVAAVVRRAAAEDRDLGRLCRRAVDALSRTLDGDRDPMARHFAALALGRIGTGEARSVLLKHYKRRSGLPASRAFMALALGISGAGEASDLLLRGVTSKGLDPSTKSAHAIALGVLNDERAGARLLTEVRDGRSAALRGAAAVAVGLMDYRRGKETLRRALATARHPALRPAIALGLGLLGDGDVLKRLEALVLTGSSAISRVEAVRSLSAIRDPAAAELLARLMGRRDLSDYTRAAAVHAAGCMARTGERSGLDGLARDWNYLLPFRFITFVVQR